MDDEGFVVVNKNDLIGKMEELEKLSNEWIKTSNTDYRLEVNKTENKLIFSVKADECVSFYVACPDQEENLVIYCSAEEHHFEFYLRGLDVLS